MPLQNLRMKPIEHLHECRRIIFLSVNCCERIVLRSTLLLGRYGRYKWIILFSSPLVFTFLRAVYNQNITCKTPYFIRLKCIKTEMIWVLWVKIMLYRVIFGKKLNDEFEIFPINSKLHKKRLQSLKSMEKLQLCMFWENRGMIHLVY